MFKQARGIILLFMEIRRQFSQKTSFQRLLMFRYYTLFQCMHDIQGLKVLGAIF